MLHAQGWRPDWGTVPSWLAAAGGIATVAAFVVAYRLYQHERDDRKAREEADRRRQAELITVWEIEGASGGPAETRRTGPVFGWG